MSFQKAATRSDLWDDEMRAIAIEGRRILLVRIDGTVHAYADRCAHQSVALSEGKLACGVLECPAHGWTYDAKTGQGLNPRAAQLESYAVRIENGDVLVDTSALLTTEARP